MKLKVKCSCDTLIEIGIAWKLSRYPPVMSFLSTPLALVQTEAGSVAEKHSIPNFLALKQKFLRVLKCE